MQTPVYVIYHLHRETRTDARTVSRGSRNPMTIQRKARLILLGVVIVALISVTWAVFTLRDDDSTLNVLVRYKIAIRSLICPEVVLSVIACLRQLHERIGIN